MKTGIIMISLAILFSGCAGSKITTDGGGVANNFKETTLIFQTNNNKTIETYELVDSKWKLLSSAPAPATVIIPGGVHTLKVDGLAIQVVAEGGKQYWQISDAKLGMLVPGATLLLGGTVLNVLIATKAVIAGVFPVLIIEGGYVAGYFMTTHAMKNAKLIKTEK
jgi:hypothetical protein